ncbi:CoB--CoM heterodisulfide reductase iron-sulfur subunit B family protein [Desulfospira joergensenii]|uniref:CoB--CoM heterodisulfide reductase iron-sulfur subunit B family protein n=1 Tax=Desulfospira joergensenii TaxID=53329 RepID=UPI0003B57FB4|nr:heterodisulfide reductase-related iron-sulfur binding cluster [Desulfospira joergensenii]
MTFQYTELSYFPGCSLATTAKENNASLISFLEDFDIELNEVEDWNCCGSSSTHSVDSNLALALASRNLFLAPEDKPLLIACPGCYLRLGLAKMELHRDKAKRKSVERHFGQNYNHELRLLHFFELLVKMGKSGFFRGLKGRLRGLKIAPYYGCMLARPPRMNKEKNHYGLIERTMGSLGGEPVQWGFSASCCGTFLSVSRPEISSTLVNRIMKGAVQSGADCIVTACAMCQLNLEIRCDSQNQIPVFHFSELLSLALEHKASKDWFNRHLINPESVLRQKQLLPCQSTG